MRSPCIRPDWPAPANVIALTTLRTGGCSVAPYASLNLADHVEDDPAAVLANRAVLSRLLPAGTRVQWLTQVHGTGTIRAGEEEGNPIADASWSRTPGRACAVLTADCLPVLFCSRRGDVVAAAHAGWRGLLGGVLEYTIAALGVQPRQLLAWLGPAIGPAAFEVGAEVRAAFLAAASPLQLPQTDASFVPSSAKPGHYFADLYSLARLRLAALGPDGVFGGGFCTFGEPDHYFSYRRDGRTGRMASLILLSQART
jgi:YfiH family protein